MSSLQCRTFSLSGNRLELYIYMDGNYAPWFRAKEVARFLGYLDFHKAIRKHVYSGNKITWDPACPEVIFINEAGMYELMFNSKLPNKQLFREWITADVLPAIRRPTTSGNVSLTRFLCAELRNKEAANQLKDKTIKEMLQAMTTMMGEMLKIIENK